MTRTVGGTLQAHLNGAATTTCRLLKITSSDSPPLVFGLTTLDKDVTYDDGSGDGPIVYSATKGFDPSTFAADVGFSVGNGEATALVGTIDGVTEEMVNAGALDDATWICYLVNYEDLTMGHIILDAGDLGTVIVRYGVLWVPELLSYIDRLKQPIGGVWSLQCRAIFGTPADSQTGCGINPSPLWVYGSVSSVGAETDRQFTGSAVTNVIVPYPGRLQFLTGDNAGRQFPTEEVSGNVVTLAEPTNYPILAGDTYRIRPDCLKRYEEDCIGVWNNGPNFKGEPLIPLGDSAEVSTPSAQLPKSNPKFVAGG